MLKQFKGKWTTCPLAGRRAAELAAGKLQSVLHEIWEQTTADLVLETAFRFRGTPAARHQILGISKFSGKLSDRPGPDRPATLPPTPARPAFSASLHRPDRDRRNLDMTGHLCQCRAYGGTPNCATAYECAASGEDVILDTTTMVVCWLGSC